MQTLNLSPFLYCCISRSYSSSYVPPRLGFDARAMRLLLGSYQSVVYIFFSVPSNGSMTSATVVS